MSASPREVALEGVTKLFGAVRALSGASLRASSGEVVAIMGRNGAGKSTLLSVLALTMRPTRGRVLFDGAPVGFGDAAARRKIGLLSHQPLVYPDMTARKNLAFFARLHGLRVEEAVDAMIDRLDLSAFAVDRPARVLSRGQLQRLSLARALISRPRLLLLDEPAAGLDEPSIARIESAIASHREDGGISVVVTHEPALAARIATRAVMLCRGLIAADTAAPPDEQGWRELFRDTAARERP